MKRLGLASLGLGAALLTAQGQVSLSSLQSGDTSLGVMVGRLRVTDSLRVAGKVVLASGQIGTATNDNASAGNIGEYMSHSTVTGSSLSLATGTVKAIDSLSLTAGDWDVEGVLDFTLASTTTVTLLAGSLSTTNSALGAQDSWFKHETVSAVMGSTDDPAWRTPLVRFSVSTTTKVFLVAQARFLVSTCKAYGSIRARRVR